MVNKHYEVTLLTTEHEHKAFLVSYEHIANLIQDMAGTRITFIPTKNPDVGTVTFYTHSIKRIEYKSVSVMPFEKSNVYQIHTSY